MGCFRLQDQFQHEFRDEVKGAFRRGTGKNVWPLGASLLGGGLHAARVPLGFISQSAIRTDLFVVAALSFDFLSGTR